MSVAESPSGRPAATEEGEEEEEAEKEKENAEPRKPRTPRSPTRLALPAARSTPLGEPGGEERDGARGPGWGPGWAPLSAGLPRESRVREGCSGRCKRLSVAKNPFSAPLLPQITPTPRARSRDGNGPGADSSGQGADGAEAQPEAGEAVRAGRRAGALRRRARPDGDLVQPLHGRRPPAGAGGSGGRAAGRPGAKGHPGAGPAGEKQAAGGRPGLPGPDQPAARLVGTLGAGGGRGRETHRERRVRQSAKIRLEWASCAVWASEKLLTLELNYHVDPPKGVWD